MYCEPIAPFLPGSADRVEFFRVPIVPIQSKGEPSFSILMGYSPELDIAYWHSAFDLPELGRRAIADRLRFAVMAELKHRMLKDFASLFEAWLIRCGWAWDDGIYRFGASIYEVVAPSSDVFGALRRVCSLYAVPAPILIERINALADAGVVGEA